VVHVSETGLSVSLHFRHPNESLQRIVAAAALLVLVTAVLTVKVKAWQYKTLPETPARLCGARAFAPLAVAAAVAALTWKPCPSSSPAASDWLLLAAERLVSGECIPGNRQGKSKRTHRLWLCSITSAAADLLGSDQRHPCEAAGLS
jgi:hypothetical protein